MNRSNHSEFKTSTSEEKYSWETIADFTKFQKKGVSINKLLSHLQNLDNDQRD